MRIWDGRNGQVVEELRELQHTYLLISIGAAMDV